MGYFTKFQNFFLSLSALILLSQIVSIYMISQMDGQCTSGKPSQKYGKKFRRDTTSKLNSIEKLLRRWDQQ